jgi:hypothetical protein
MKSLGKSYNARRLLSLFTLDHAQSIRHPKGLKASDDTLGDHIHMA